MADFNEALKTVLKHEGAFSNQSNDSGGATHFGISAQLLSAFLKHPVSVDEMRALSLEDAAHIYRQVFWDSMNLTSLKNQALATVIFDLSVLSGVPFVVKTIQDILNIFTDGILGSHTVNAINDYLDATWLGLELIEAMEIHFIEIALKDASQLQFLKGWVQRTHGLLNLLFQTSTGGK